MFLLENRDVGFHGRGVVLAVVAIVFTSLSLTTVVCRFVCRHLHAGRYGNDDRVIAFSMVYRYPILSVRSMTDKSISCVPFALLALLA